jgi:hypothetical protein
MQGFRIAYTNDSICLYIKNGKKGRIFRKKMKIFRFENETAGRSFNFTFLFEKH